MGNFINSITDALGFTNYANEEAAGRAEEAQRAQTNAQANAATEANKLYMDYMNRALDVQGRSMEEQKAAQLAAMLMQLGMAGNADLSFRQMLNVQQAQQLPYQTARISALQSLPILQKMAGTQAYRLPAEVTTTDFTTGQPDYGLMFKNYMDLIRTGDTEPGIPVPKDAAGNPIPDNIRASTPTPTPTTVRKPPYPYPGYGNHFSPDATAAPLRGGPYDPSMPDPGLTAPATPSEGGGGPYDPSMPDPGLTAPATPSEGGGGSYDPSIRTPPGVTPTPTPTSEAPDTTMDDLVTQIIATGMFSGGDGGDMTSTTTPLEAYDPEYSYEDSPLYQFRKKESEQAMGRALRARGMYGSETGALISAKEQERIAAEEAENQYRRVADIVNIGLGGQATAGAIPQQAGSTFARSYQEVGQDVANSINTAAQNRAGMYNQQQQLLQNTGTGAAENLGQIGAINAQRAGIYVPPAAGNNFLGTAAKLYGMYTGFGGGGGGGTGYFGSPGSWSNPTSSYIPYTAYK